MSAGRNISDLFPVLLSTDLGFVCSLNEKNTLKIRGFYFRL